MKEFLNRNFDIIFAMLLIFFFAAVVIFTGAADNAEKVQEYEKILNHEYGQTFDSYNEYLVYKIERGY